MVVWWQGSHLRGFSELNRERCTQSSLCDAIILTAHHRAEMMAGHLSSEGVSFSPIKSYTKAWILCKMLEKSKFLLPSNTRGKAESSKDFRKLSPVMGKKCARPPACLVDRMEEDRVYPGFWSVLYYGWLSHNAHFTPSNTEVIVLWDWSLSLVSLIYFWTGSMYVALAYSELTDIGLPLPSNCLESYALPLPT